MKRRLQTALILAAATALAACATPQSPEAAAAAATDEQHCEALTGATIGNATIGNATIDKAEIVEKGDQLLGFFTRTLIRIAVPGLPPLKAPAGFCRATATLRPAQGSEIKVLAWLPNQWNGKLLANGGAGFSGGYVFGPAVMLTPVGKGYATIVTDAGHKATDSAEFSSNPEQFTDYGHRANHVAAAFAKQLLKQYYKAPVKRAYFHGCSNGGRDALMEARRYPEDYDGIIAGAPAAAWTKLMTSFAWNVTAIAQDAPKLTKKLQLVQDAVIAKCDTLDGVKDGILENPLECKFDPAELQCKGKEASDCLSAGEVTALKKIYQGPRLGNGQQVYAGMPPGGEALPGNWDKWITDGDDASQYNFAQETLRWMVHRNPDWEMKDFNLDSDYALAQERVARILNSDDPDISGFTRRGGKLMLYHGWNDGGISAGWSVDYHNNVQKALGPAAADSVRLFMVPGMMHCAGGIGPNAFDALGELDQWVTSGKAPNRITATEYDPPFMLVENPEAKPIRTRPLCAWPKTAHYNGKGSTDEAANFSCK